MAALASGLSEGARAVWLLWQARRRGIPGQRSDGWRLHEFWRILRVGLPAVWERLITHAMQLFFASIVIGFSVAAYAAHQVGLNIESLSWLPGLGFAKAATALVGRRLGARDPGGARRCARLANLLAVGGWLVCLATAYLGGMRANLGRTIAWATMVLDWIVRCSILSWHFRRLSLSDVRL